MGLARVSRLNHSITNRVKLILMRMGPQVRSNSIRKGEEEGGALLSPPGSSDPTSETLDQFGSEVVGSSENGLSASIDIDAWPLPGGEMAMQDFSVDSYEFLNNASWGTPSCPQDVGADLLFDNIFAPDTGEFSRLCM